MVMRNKVFFNSTNSIIEFCFLYVLGSFVRSGEIICEIIKIGYRLVIGARQIVLKMFLKAQW